MQFMTLIKSAEDSKIGPPPAELLQAIGRLGGEAAQAGVLVDTAGLLPTAVGARVRLKGGQVSINEEPSVSGQEVVGAYAIFKVQSKQDAIAWAKRFMELHKEHWKGWEGETEVRQVMQTPGTGEARAKPEISLERGRREQGHVSVLLLNRCLGWMEFRAGVPLPCWLRSPVERS